MTDRFLPPGLHRDTLAVRAALERSQYGENSEALFLTSSFVQPDAETSARRFAGTEEGFTYTRTSNPTTSGGSTVSCTNVLTNGSPAAKPLIANT